MGSTAVDRAVRAVRAAVARVVADGAPALFGVACSGGADSLALADATIAIAGAQHVIVLVIDHGLQTDSDKVAERVATWARGQGAAAVVRRVDIAGRGEAAARRARYSALDDLASELGCWMVLLGHTRRDQAETVLMRIVRGTGPAGLAGMSKGRHLWARPLLDVRRADVEAYCAARALPVWEDPMNDDPAFTRVRARHEWMPMLARENPQIEDALVRLAEQTREWLDVMDGLATADELLAPVDCRALARRPPAVIKRVVARMLEGHGLGYTAAHLIAACKLVCAPRRGTVAIDVPNGRIVRVYDTLEVRGAGPAEDNELELIAVPPGHALRTWQPGDRMRLARLHGHSRKLSDLFADLRVPRAARALARVVVRGSDGEITWADHVGHAAPRPV